MNNSSSSENIKDNAFSVFLEETQKENENNENRASILANNQKEKVFKVRLDLKKNIWTKQEDKLLRNLVTKFGAKKWNNIAKFFDNKTSVQCSARFRRMKKGIKKDPWSNQEDKQLIELVKIYGKNWSLISNMMKNRSGKQIRERYINNLDPNIIRREFNEEEDNLIYELQKKHGNKWTLISKHFQKRTGDMIKNRFHSFVKLRLKNEKKNLNDNANEVNTGSIIDNINKNKVNDTKNTIKAEEHLKTSEEIKQKNSAFCFAIGKKLQNFKRHKNKMDTINKNFHYSNKKNENNLKNNETVFNDFEIDFKDENYALIEDKFNTDIESKGIEIFSNLEKTNNNKLKLEKNFITKKIKNKLEKKLENFNLENEFNYQNYKKGNFIALIKEKIQTYPYSNETSNKVKVLGRSFNESFTYDLKRKGDNCLLGKKPSRDSEFVENNNNNNKSLNVNDNKVIMINNFQTFNNITKNEYLYTNDKKNIDIENNDDDNNQLSLNNISNNYIQNIKISEDNNLLGHNNSKKINIENVLNRNTNTDKLSHKLNPTVKIFDKNIKNNYNINDLNNKSNINSLSEENNVKLNNEISKLLTINFINSFSLENKKLVLQQIQILKDSFSPYLYLPMLSDYFHYTNEKFAKFYNYVKTISFQN